MGKSRASLQYLLYLGQVKLCGQELLAGAVFIIRLDNNTFSKKMLKL